MKFISSIALFLFFSLIDLSGQTISIHSITWTRQNGGDYGYTLDGIWMMGGRSKLLNSAYFGSSGVYPKSISIVDGYGTSGSLTQVSALPVNTIFYFGGFIKNAPYTEQFTDEEIDSVYNWSVRGGKLIIAANANGVGLDLAILNEKWGFHDALKYPSYLDPTAAGAATELLNGPFGVVSYAAQGGYIQGYFDTLPSNSVVFANDPVTNKPSLIMDCTTLDLIAADVDVFTNIGGMSTGNTILNMQDKLWANTIAFMDKLQAPPQITLTRDNFSVMPVYNSYQWYLNDSPVAGATNTNFINSESGKYYVEVVVNGGCKIKSNVIAVDSIPDEILVLPNIFTPNGDGANDLFIPLKISGLTIEKITIYNRWGNEIHDASMPEVLWDGTIQKNSATEGTYFWTIEYQNTKGSRKKMTGFIELKH